MKETAIKKRHLFILALLCNVWASAQEMQTNSPIDKMNPVVRKSYLELLGKVESFDSLRAVLDGKMPPLDSIHDSFHGVLDSGKQLEKHIAAEDVYEQTSDVYNAYARWEQYWAGTLKRVGAAKSVISDLSSEYKNGIEFLDTKRQQYYVSKYATEGELINLYNGRFRPGLDGYGAYYQHLFDSLKTFLVEMDSLHTLAKNQSKKLIELYNAYQAGDCNRVLRRLQKYKDEAIAHLGHLEAFNDSSRSLMEQLKRAKDLADDLKDWTDEDIDPDEQEDREKITQKISDSLPVWMDLCKRLPMLVRAFDKRNEHFNRENEQFIAPLTIALITSCDNFKESQMLVRDRNKSLGGMRKLENRRFFMTKEIPRLLEKAIEKSREFGEKRAELTSGDFRLTLFGDQSRLVLKAN